MPNRHFLTASYDDIGDVLYIRTERRLHTRNVEEVAGLVLRYDIHTRAPVGATVMDYKEYWLPRRKDLVARLSDFFHVPAQEAEKILEVAV